MGSRGYGLIPLHRCLSNGPRFFYPERRVS